MSNPLLSLTEKSVVIETQYFPPLSFWIAALNAKEVQLEAHENYQKGSYRNRCHIATAQGLQVLSIPLKKGKNAQQNITEVEIAHDFDWQKQHRESLQTAYGSAPFWAHYAPVLLPIFEKKPTHLFDFNLEIITVFSKILKLDAAEKLKKTAFFVSNTISNETDDMVNLKNTISPKKAITHQIRYPQIFQDRHDFLPDLSIIDLIMCVGARQAREILRGGFF